MKKLSVIIPCFNEVATIQEIIRRVEAVNIPGWTKEIIVIDDASTDGTPKVLRVYESRHTIIYHQKNQGRGYAVRHGIDRATGDYLFIQDADLEYDPSEIPSFIRALEEGKGDCIYGSRRLYHIKRRGNYIPRTGVWVMTQLFNLIYGTRLTDLWTCYKLFAKEDGALYPPGRFEGDMLFPAHLIQRGRKIVEIPISHYPRTVKEGKKVRVKDGLFSLWLLITDWLTYLYRSPRTETVLFLLTISVRTFFFSALLAWVAFSGAFPREAQRIFPVLGGDSGGYVKIAENLLNYGKFSLSSGEPFFPDSFRTPGYPFFLAVLLPIIGKIGVIFLQILLSACTVVLVYKLAARFIPKPAALIGAVLLAIDPYSMFLSSILLSETLFTFFLVVSVYLLFFSTTSFRGQLAVSAVSGVFLGLATLTRPIGQFLIPLFALFVILQLFQRFRFRAVVVSGVFVLAGGLTLLPWIIRNVRVYDSYQLSSVTHNNILYTNIALHYALENGGMELEDARNIFRAQVSPTASIEELRSLYYDDESIKVMFEYFREHGTSYGKFHIVKMVPFFVSDGLRDIAQLLHFEGRPVPNFTDLILTGRINELFAKAREGGYFLALLLIGSSIWALLSLCAFLGTLLGLWKVRDSVFFLSLCALLTLYFAVASAPIAPARMRAVSEPFFFTLAASGVWEIYTRARTLFSRRFRS